jgi:hypothetical protein
MVISFTFSWFINFKKPVEAADPKGLADL